MEAPISDAIGLTVGRFGEFCPVSSRNGTSEREPRSRRLSRPAATSSSSSSAESSSSPGGTEVQSTVFADLTYEIWRHREFSSSRDMLPRHAESFVTVNGSPEVQTGKDL